VPWLRSGVHGETDRDRERDRERESAHPKLALWTGLRSRDSSGEQLEHFDIITDNAAIKEKVGRKITKFFNTGPGTTRMFEGEVKTYTHYVRGGG
jgi:hypothetical protein